MKKMIVTLAISLSTLAAFAGEETNVNARVLEAFKTEFSTAKDVEWTEASNYYTATFTYNERKVSAYYDKEGELLGITRYISPDDLPLNLQANLRSRMGKNWISDLSEVSTQNETVYYATIDDADTRVILKSTDGSNWTQYKKVKKS